MTREEIIDGLKAVRTIHNGNYAPQIDEAIKSLDMWDKVIREIDDVNKRYHYMYADALSEVIDIIEKYKKEIEKWINMKNYKNI